LPKIQQPSMMILPQREGEAPGRALDLLIFFPLAPAS
jgi:hypothetical protein